MQRGEAVCSYCGAMAPAPTEEGRGFFSAVIPAQPEPKPSEPKKTRPLFPSEAGFPAHPAEADFPELEGAELEEAARGEAPPPAGERQPPPRPSVPTLLRFLAPLLFLLIPLANFLLRDSSLTLPFQKPSLREAIVCESVRDGLPVNPKDVFSLSKDRQIVLYTLWRGRPGSYSYAARWHPPQGRAESLPETTLQYQAGRRGFAAYGALPLEPAMEQGPWRVEIYLDGEALESVRFELRE